MEDARCTEGHCTTTAIDGLLRVISGDENIKSSINGVLHFKLNSPYVQQLLRDDHDRRGNPTLSSLHQYLPNMELMDHLSDDIFMDSTFTTTTTTTSDVQPSPEENSQEIKRGRFFSGSDENDDEFLQELDAVIMPMSDEELLFLETLCTREISG